MKKYTLRIPANLQISACVRDIAVHIFSEAGLNNQEVSRLKLVFDELFMNAVKYGSTEGSLLDISFERENNTLRVCIEDEGGESQLSAEELKKIISYQENNTNPQKKSGRGLAQIANKWTDDLNVWNSNKGGLCVCFSKTLSGESVHSAQKETEQKEKSSRDLYTKLQSMKDFPQKEISLEGEIDDASLIEKTKQIEAVLQTLQTPTIVVIDLSQLQFCNSTFIAKLVTWWQESEQKGGTCVLQNVPPEIFEIFELVGLTKILFVSTDPFTLPDTSSESPEAL